MTETATRSPWGRRLRRLAVFLVVAILLVVPTFFALGGARVLNLFKKPSTPFAAQAAPPAPDYARPDAWFAWPGRNGMERSTPLGMTPVDEAKAPVDVFFIHPTTIHGNTVWNAPFDASDELAPLNPPVLLGQLSVFNGCCRLYAPHYRQATLAGLKNPPAFALAYGDVAAAFRYYIAHENHGRPFIIASHSQGTGHAIQLLQREILGTPLQARMVAAYLIGGYVPEDFARIGLPVCDAPKQTSCILSWNTSKAGWNIPRKILLGHPSYWWQGAIRTTNPAPAICVDPLTWRANGSGTAAMNPGSLGFPKAPFPAHATTMPALVPNLTGTACNQRMLEVSLPWSPPPGFSDPLSRLLGSYHLNDYGLFYASLRQNAIDRVAAWQAAHPAQEGR